MTPLDALALIPMTSRDFARATRATRGAKNFACLECGRRMGGAAAARACDRGCPNCGSVDIDCAPMAKEA